MSPYKYGVQQLISSAYEVQPTCQLFKTNSTGLLKKYDLTFFHRSNFGSKSLQKTSSMAPLFVLIPIILCQLRFESQEPEPWI
jgi:hypothetical protein